MKLHLARSRSGLIMQVQSDCSGRSEIRRRNSLNAWEFLGTYANGVRTGGRYVPSITHWGVLDILEQVQVAEITTCEYQYESTRVTKYRKRVATGRQARGAQLIQQRSTI